MGWWTGHDLQRSRSPLRANCPIADAMETKGIAMAIRTTTIALTTDIGTVNAVEMFRYDRS